MDRYLIPIYDGIVLMIALLAAVGGAVYYFFSLAPAGLSASVILSILSFIVLSSYVSGNLPRTVPFSAPRRSIALSTIVTGLIPLLLIATAMTLVLRGRTELSAISPWESVSPLLFLAVPLALAAFFKFAYVAPRAALFTLPLFFFLLTAVGVLVFTIGFGYDVFIHDAALKHIAAFASIEPKTPYYAGFYALAMIVGALPGLGVATANTFLVPALASLLLPFAVYAFFRRFFGDTPSIVPTILLIALIPLTPFTLSTPQNLGYLFFLLCVLNAYRSLTPRDLLTAGALAVATAVIHPIAGIPALAAVALAAVHHSDRPRLKPFLSAAIGLVAAASLPVLFFLLERTQGNGDTTAPTSAFPLPVVPGSESAVLNALYLYGFNLEYLLALALAAGLWLAYRYRKECGPISVSIVSALSLLVAYALGRFVPFSFLIAYERSDYLERLLVLAVLASAPFLLFALYAAAYRVVREPIRFRLIALIFAAALSAAALYFSYPRFDRYHNSHSYSVGRADIDAVRAIEQGEANDFIVLANQQVSAAALHEFGFKRYFDIDVDGRSLPMFYYPVPTGGPLYPFYLDMVYKRPDRATVIRAMDLAGVDSGYFVLNKYWWAFPKLVEEAKLEADGWQAFGNGAVYIFTYTRRLEERREDGKQTERKQTGPVVEPGVS